MNIIDLGLNFREMTMGNTPKTMYLHHSGGIDTVLGYHNQHLAKGWAGLAYNAVVDLDGKHYKGRDPHAVPAGVLGHNQDSFHIMAIGNFNNMIMPEVQKEGLKEAVAYYKALYSTLTTIKGHKEETATDCPGNNYPLNEIKSVFIDRLIQQIPIPTPSPIRNKVFKLQHALNLTGVTDKAGNRLVEDGWIGTHTLEALAKVAIHRGANNAIVGWIQEQLNIHVDNLYGFAPWHETYDAILSFQKVHGLYEDAVPGINTITKML